MDKTIISYIIDAGSIPARGSTTIKGLIVNKQKLIDFLQALPDDVELIHSSDEEGNHLSELYFSTSQIIRDASGHEIFEVAEEDIGTVYDAEAVRRAAIFW